MKVLTLLAFACVASMYAQTTAHVALQDIPDQETIVKFGDGGTLTAGQLKAFISVLDPNNQQLAANAPEMLIQQISFMRKLTKMAEEHGLDKKSPTKDQLEFNRWVTLSQVMAHDALDEVVVSNEDILKAYEARKNNFKQVKVNAIYIAFGDGGTTAEGEKTLTEEQAKAKTEKLLAQIRGGANFAKLARENSDDTTSKEKDGFFATLKPSDNIPDGFKVVFTLKEGETSQPVRQPNGFYLLRAEAVSYTPLAEVREQIFNDLKQQGFRAFLDNANKLNVTYPSPKFQPKSAQAPQTPPSAK